VAVLFTTKNISRPAQFQIERGNFKTGAQIAELFQCRQPFARDIARLIVSLRRVLDAEPKVTIDYAEIVDAETLEPAMSLRRNCYVLLAARVGNTRLIDNAFIEQDGESLRVTL